MTILVAGATGTTGSAVVAALRERGAAVRAVTRSHRKATALREAGTTAVVADFADAASLRLAFDGVSAAYIATPSSPDMASTETPFARAAADAGAHLVKLSTLGATTDSGLRFGRMHAASEAAIEAVSGSWTFVQPTGWMQNDLAWAAQVPSGTIAGAVMDASWSIVDVRDAVAVAVSALLDPATLTGRRIAVTGQAARTPRDRVQALATILGRELAAVDVPTAHVAAQLRGYGVGEWEVGGLVELFELYAAGYATAVAPDAAEVLGRATRTWEEFAADHVHAFNG